MRAVAAGLILLSRCDETCDETWDRTVDRQGFSYVGCQNRSAPTFEYPEGLACQPWNSQVPHEHPFDPRVRDNSFIPSNVDIGFNNYCRNPTSAPGGIYCFTMDPAVRFAYCCPLDRPGCDVPGPLTPRPTPRPTMPGKKVNVVGGAAEPIPPCGNGKLEDPNEDGLAEMCDDANVEDGDGCSAECTIEAGFQCETEEGKMSICAGERNNTILRVVQAGSAMMILGLAPFLYFMWKTHQMKKFEPPKEGEAIVQMPDGSYRKVNAFKAIIRIQCMIRRQKARREMKEKLKQRHLGQDQATFGKGTVVPDNSEPGVSAGPAPEAV
jgi:cysteine-rich repeat protein